MFLSPGNEPPEENIQLLELIQNNLKCKATAVANDMESGRGGGGSTSSSLISSSSDQRARRREEEQPSGGATSFFAKCFSLPFILLACVTATLLILPLVLPPLPPPPLMLMLVPVAMLVLLMVLALMPASVDRNATDAAYSSFLVSSFGFCDVETGL